MLLFLFWKHVVSSNVNSGSDFKIFWKNLIINTPKKLPNVADWCIRGSIKLCCRCHCCPANIPACTITQGKVHFKWGLTGIKWVLLGSIGALRDWLLHWLLQMTAIKQIFCWQEPLGAYHSHPPSWQQETANVSRRHQWASRPRWLHVRCAFKSNWPWERCNTPLMRLIICKVWHELVRRCSL